MQNLFPSVILVRSVLDPDEYEKASSLMDLFPLSSRLVLVIHRDKQEEGLWKSPHPQILVANCHGLSDDGPETPIHPTTFNPLLQLFSGTPLESHPSWFDLTNLSSDFYLGGAVRQEVQLLEARAHKRALHH